MMRDPHTGILGKKTRKRMDSWKIKYLEKEYKKAIKLGDTNIIWGKKAMKKIA
jgi:hypothetical protein